MPNARWVREPGIKTLWSGTVTGPWRCSSKSIADATAPHQHPLLLSFQILGPSSIWLAEIEHTAVSWLQGRLPPCTGGGLNMGISPDLERPLKGCKMIIYMASALYSYRFHGTSWQDSTQEGQRGSRGTVSKGGTEGSPPKLGKYPVE